MQALMADGGDEFEGDDVSDGEGDEFEMHAADGFGDSGGDMDDSDGEEAFAIALSRRLSEAANRELRVEPRAEHRGEEKEEREEKEDKEEKQEEAEEAGEDADGLPLWFTALCSADRLLVCLISRDAGTFHPLPNAVVHAAVGATHAAALMKEHPSWSAAEDATLVRMADTLEEGGADLMKGDIPKVSDFLSFAML
jgi:hypothetical protein